MFKSSSAKKINDLNQIVKNQQATMELQEIALKEVRAENIRLKQSAEETDQKHQEKLRDIHQELKISNTHKSQLEMLLGCFGISANGARGALASFDAERSLAVMRPFTQSTLSEFMSMPVRSVYDKIPPEVLEMIRIENEEGEVDDEATIKRLGSLLLTLSRLTGE